MLHEQATAGTLAGARIWLFGLAAVHVLLNPSWEIALLPGFEAVGVMRYLGAELWGPQLSPAAMIAGQVVTILVLLAVAAGCGPYRLLAPLACVCLTLYEGLLRGLGANAHAPMILLLGSYLLAAFPAADRLALTRQRDSGPGGVEKFRAPLVALSLVFGMTYMLAAARRLVVGGWEIYLDDTILFVTALRDAELGGDGGWGRSVCQSLPLAWALRIGFPLVTILELLSPACVFSRRFRWLWLAVMVPFHIGTGLLMGIWFSYNILLAPLLVAGWDPSRLLRRPAVPLAPAVDGTRVRRAA